MRQCEEICHSFAVRSEIESRFAPKIVRMAFFLLSLHNQLETEMMRHMIYELARKQVLLSRK